MPTNKENITELQEKLDALLQKHYDFSREITALRVEIENLKIGETEPASEQEGKLAGKVAAIMSAEEPPEQTKPEQPTSRTQPPPKPPGYLARKRSQHPQAPSDLEKFIGENLINKIGILILIIGVAIGAKYAIDHQLISPLTRIILGYLVGGGLLAFAIRLKKNYENFSAVLLSGAIAILYFITFFAYASYDLIPQVLAFTLMVVFTTFAVVAALRYDMQVIALFGLVGAYAVPYLLSDGSGNVAILFSYTALINAGILAIAVRKYWKPIYYSAFILSWLIYFSWFVFSYRMEEHFGLALIFLSIFFATFYLTFLLYKLLQKETFKLGDILMLLTNAFVFYGIGYAILDSHPTGAQLLGLFTLGNAIVHAIVAYIIHREKLADRNLFFFVSGLVLVFITIAFPVQLDGNWVTLLWVGEAALLFWIGRTKNVPVYEKLAYPLMFLAFFSLLDDWGSDYSRYYPSQPETRITPLLNINFLSAALFIAALGFINWLNSHKNYTPALNPQKLLSKIIFYSIPAILLFALYSVFRLEIANYWEQQYADSALTINTNGEQYPGYYWNDDLNLFKTIWGINYSLFFVTVLSFFNIKKLKNQNLGFSNIGLNVLAIIIFLTAGLPVLGALRESYLDQTLAEYYHRAAFNIGIRYISFAFVGLAIFACYQYIRQDFMKLNLSLPFDLLLHGSILSVASSELINWMEIAGSGQSHQLGLSILWGIYSLLLIVLGIWKKKVHLRVGAIILFGVTLVKLLFYDLSHLDTISKTVVFVSLGILLLIISFLYNKYKHIIADDREN